ncbi:hypothetical protein EUX57_05860 [Pseudomonas orientalis]|uniref:Uncharacterized protein n=1 Tax=Pseudomonas orientalis TaxID=76758 RepID=A0A4Q7D4M1_9PSED|nr:hypothetical protein EUX57_05860 [Pseudomonas orientalis]
MSARCSTAGCGTGSNTARSDAPPPVGASLLAKTTLTTRSSRMPALSLTIFASKLAPTRAAHPITNRS